MNQNGRSGKIDAASGDSVILSTLEEFKKAGVIGRIGIGGKDLTVNTALSRQGELMWLRSLRFSRADARETLLPAAQRQDVGVITWWAISTVSIGREGLGANHGDAAYGIYPWSFDERVLRRIDSHLRSCRQGGLIATGTRPSLSTVGQGFRVSSLFAHGRGASQER